MAIKSRARASFKGVWLLRPGHHVVLWNNLINAVAMTMFSPLLVYYLSHHLGYSYAFSGITAGLGAAFQFSMMLPGGLLADRIQARSSMLMGWSFRTVAFIMFLGVDTFLPREWVFLAIGLNAISVAIMAPSVRRFANAPKGNTRTRVLSLFYLGSNLGSTLGPLLGGILMYRHTSLVFSLFVLLFVFLFLSAFFGIPKEPIKTQPIFRFEMKKLSPLLAQYAQKLWLHVFASASFLLLFNFFRYYLAIYIQDTHQGFGGWIFGYSMGLNAICIIVLQPLLMRFLMKQDAKKLYTIGVFSLGLGLFLVGLNQLWSLSLGMFALALGELFTYIKSEIEIAQVSKKHIGVLFGVSRLFWALVVLGSGLVGGYSYQYAHQLKDESLFWFAGALMSLVFFGFFLVLFGVSFLKKSSLNSRGKSSVN